MVIKRKGFGYSTYWLRSHRMLLDRYISRFYTPYDWHNMGWFFFKNPTQARVILEDFSRSNDAKLQEVVKVFVYGKSKIVYIVGARDSGKTATTFMFAECVNNTTNRPIFYVSVGANKKLFPEWMKVVEDIDKVPCGAFAIVDEASIQFNARNFAKQDNKQLIDILAIARHNDIFLIFITQHTSLVDKTIRTLKDMVIWKMSNDYTIGETSGRQSREHQFWSKVRSIMAPRKKEECLFEYPSMRRFVNFTHGLAECWSDELSKSWQNIKFTQIKESEAMEKGQQQNPIKKREVLRI